MNIQMNIPENILVIVPHPDDETLMCAGVIRRAVAGRARIFVAIVTNGDYLCPDESKGRLRLSESITAMRILGLAEDNLFFLGYPDTGMERETAFLVRLYDAADPGEVFPTGRGRETYGIRESKPDFCFMRTGSHALYNRASFQADLAALFHRTKPELVITTSEWDRHGDHSALSAFVRDTLRRRKNETGQDPLLWEGLVHSPAGDDCWPLPEHPYAELTMPPGLEEQTGLRWEERIRMPLPAEMMGQPMENHLKFQAIMAYRTALKFTEEPDVVRYLLGFTKREEIFWAVDYR